MRRFLDEVSPLWVSGLAVLLMVLTTKRLEVPVKEYEWTLYMVLGTIFPALAVALTLLSRIARIAPIYRILERSLAIYCMWAAGRFLIGHWGSYGLAAVVIPVSLLITFFYFKSSDKRSGGFATEALAQARRAGDSHPETHTQSAISGDRIDASTNILMDPRTAESPWAITGVPDKDSRYSDRPELGMAKAQAPKRSDGKIRRLWIGDGYALVITLFFLLLAWGMSVRLLWWDSLEKWISGSLYGLLAFILASILVLVNLSHKGASVGHARLGSRPADWIANLFALIIIVLASFKIDRAFHADNLSTTFYHWGYYVGTVELIRQGGWLLWDVPIYYGFLSILTLALCPIKSAWQSLYVVNALLLILTAGFLFFVLRSLRTGRTNWLFALAVTLAGIFLLPGLGTDLTGPQIWPSIGPLRFFWCYVLLAVLLWGFQRARAQRPNGVVLWMGCAAWLVGTLWSAESAAYCAGIWLPAYVLLVAQETASFYREHGRLSRSLRRVALWIALPLVMLAVTLGAIAVYYQFVLGHAPDWRSSFEFALAVKAGTLTNPVAKDGPIWSLVLLFCAVSTVAVYFIRNGPIHALALISGIWGFLWTTSSYPIVRGVSPGFTCMSPIYCTVIALTLYIFAQQKITGQWARWIKISFIPFLIVLLTATFGNAELTEMARNTHLGYNSNIDRLLPLMDKSAMRLLHSAHAKSSDPLIYITKESILPPARIVKISHGYRRVSFSPAWLPLRPAPFSPKLHERAKISISRFIDRIPMSGYLLISAEMRPEVSWLFDRLMRTHIPTKSLENSDYQLIWFEHKDPNKPPDAYADRTVPDIYFRGIRSTFTGGFYSLEETEEMSWRWCGPNRGILTLENFAEQEKPLTIAMTITTAQETRASVRISGAGFADEIQINSEETPYQKSFTIPAKSKIELTFHSDAPKWVELADWEGRELSFRLINFKIIEAKPH